MQYSLNVLGGLDVRGAGGAQLQLSLAKAKGMLAFLALAPEGSASREDLISVWWSDRPARQASQSLRQTLLALKRELARCGISALRTERRRVSLNLAQFEVDALSLRHLARSGARLTTDKALALPSGEFLESVVTRDPVGDAWIADRASEYNQLRIQLMEEALRKALAADDMAGVEDLGRTILKVDPAAETAHTALITAFLARGERNLAVRQGQLRRRSASARLPSESKHDREPAAPVRGSSASIGQRHVQVPPPGATPPGLLIMPFVCGDGVHRTSRLAYGLVDDLLVDLSRMALFAILPPGTAASLKLDTAGSLEAARRLGVEYCLSGSVETQQDAGGGRFRLNVMLSEAHTGRVLWAERYERPDRDIWIVRNELSGRIASVATNVADMVEFERAKETDTRNRNAWTLRVLAQRNFVQYTRAGNSRARTLFTKALALDPGFARAEAGIGWTHMEPETDPTR